MDKVKQSSAAHFSYLHRAHYETGILSYYVEILQNP
jgi:hypothetical protein